MVEVAISGASARLGSALTRKRAITRSRGLTEAEQTGPAIQTGTCVTGVTGSPNWDDEKNTRPHPEGPEETEIHTQTCPERRLRVCQNSEALLPQRVTYARKAGRRVMRLR